MKKKFLMSAISVAAVALIGAGTAFCFHLRGQYIQEAAADRETIVEAFRVLSRGGAAGMLAGMSAPRPRIVLKSGDAQRGVYEVVADADNPDSPKLEFEAKTSFGPIMGWALGKYKTKLSLTRAANVDSLWAGALADAGAEIVLSKSLSSDFDVSLRPIDAEIRPRGAQNGTPLVVKIDKLQYRFDEDLRAYAIHADIPTLAPKASSGPGESVAPFTSLSGLRIDMKQKREGKTGSPHTGPADIRLESFTPSGGAFSLEDLRFKQDNKSENGQLNSLCSVKIGKILARNKDLGSFKGNIELLRLNADALGGLSAWKTVDRAGKKRLADPFFKSKPTLRLKGWVWKSDSGKTSLDASLNFEDNDEPGMAALVTSGEAKVKTSLKQLGDAFAGDDAASRRKMEETFKTLAEKGLLISKGGDKYSVSVHLDTTQKDTLDVNGKTLRVGQALRSLNER